MYIYPYNRPWRPVGVWDVEAPTFSLESRLIWWSGCQPYAPAALYPQEYSWYSFLLEAESTHRAIYVYIFWVYWSGMRLSPLGTSATNWPTVPTVPTDRWTWSSRWNENLKGKPKYSEKTCPSAILYTKNPTWPDLGPNPGHHGEKPATNRLSYGRAYVCMYVYSIEWLGGSK
jgi:hypothetical protein